MLAYVFWHWPQANVASATYEQLQRAFHAALASASPTGFVASSAFRIDGGAPWLGGAPAYTDWYLLENSAALDTLNVAAVSGICEEPHNAVARAMAAGAGSLFALRTGHPDLATVRYLTCLTKPRPMPYPEFDAQVAAVEASPPPTVWRRALVLGPTPEFAALSPSRLTFSAELQPLHLDLQPL
jgi:hypothetical protein